MFVSTRSGIPTKLQLELFLRRHGHQAGKTTTFPLFLVDLVAQVDRLGTEFLGISLELNKLLSVYMLVGDW